MDGAARSGKAVQVSWRKEWCREDWRGWAVLGSLGREGFVEARSGLARHGADWQGTVRFGIQTK